MLKHFSQDDLIRTSMLDFKSNSDVRMFPSNLSNPVGASSSAANQSNSYGWMCNDSFGIKLDSTNLNASESLSSNVNFSVKKSEVDTFQYSTAEQLEPRPYSCKLCEASFSKKFCLANHIVTVHQVGGKYICKHCGKQFLQKIRYNTHMDRHNDIRRHVCQTCGRAFSYKYSLWSHAKKCALNENSSVAAADNEVMLSASSMSAEAKFQALDNQQGSEYVGNLLKIKLSPKYDIENFEWFLKFRHPIFNTMNKDINVHVKKILNRFVNGSFEIDFRFKINLRLFVQR